MLSRRASIDSVVICLPVPLREKDWSRGVSDVNAVDLMSCRERTWKDSAAEAVCLGIVDLCSKTTVVLIPRACYAVVSATYAWGIFRETVEMFERDAGSMQMVGMIYLCYRHRAWMMKYKSKYPQSEILM
jgi:hypothetical protein